MVESDIAIPDELAQAGAHEDTDAPLESQEYADESMEKGPQWHLLAIAAGLPLVFFFLLPPLTRAGLWDPYELNVADFARRIALNLHGATQLALEGADNSLPHLNDLGRPQLPFTSIALGFKAFGLHEWSGRSPLALWGLMGVLATYGWVSRLTDRRAGVFSAVALTTMPLYFVQARTMIGDIVMMSAFAMAFGGLLVAVFDRGNQGEANVGARAAWLLVGIAGLFAGYFTRGGWIGVATPALAVTLAYVLSLANAERRFDGLSHGVGIVGGFIGLYFVYRAVTAFDLGRNADLSPWLGAMIRPPTKYPTFDFTLGHIASGLAPWSGFAPFAFGRLFIAPKTSSHDAFVRESGTRAALLVATGIAFVAHGWLAARTDLVAFAAPSVIAAACGVALRDYERGAHPSLAVGVGTAVLLGVFHHELHNLPEKAFHAFAVVGATFPESFKSQSYVIWTVVLVGFAGIAFLTMVERDSKRVPFEPENYVRVLIALRDAWDGILALGYFALVASASLAGLAAWLGTRFHASWLPAISLQTRGVVLNAWWITAFGPIGIIFGMFFWCDVWLWAFGRARPLSWASASRGIEPFAKLWAVLSSGRLGTSVADLIMGRLVVSASNLEAGVGPMALFVLAPLMLLQAPAIAFAGLYLSGKTGPVAAVGALIAIPASVLSFLLLGLMGDILRGSRAAFLVVFATVVGGILCFSFYPALANQLSPKEVFESYQRIHTSGEPLALFGVGGRTAAYYAGGQPLLLKDAESAHEWLMGASPSSRRFLAVRAEELPRLNRLYRERSGTKKNLPVLDARSSQIILVASSLRGDEVNQNPLDRIVFSDMPQVQNKLSANLEDKLEVVGYDITDATGKLVDRVTASKKYRMRTYFKVLTPITTEWQMFIHIDGFHRRHNGDHKVTEGKYPMSLWMPGDVVMDDHEFSLEPNFSAGAYTVYFGLFIGETRLKVKSGTSDGENRVNGGVLRVQ